MTSKESSFLKSLASHSLIPGQSEPRLDKLDRFREAYGGLSGAKMAPFTHAKAKEYAKTMAGTWEQCETAYKSVYKKNPGSNYPGVAGWFGVEEEVEASIPQADPGDEAFVYEAVLEDYSHLKYHIKPPRGMAKELINSIQRRRRGQHTDKKHGSISDLIRELDGYRQSNRMLKTSRHTCGACGNKTISTTVTQRSLNRMLTRVSNHDSDGIRCIAGGSVTCDPISGAQSFRSFPGDDDIY